MENNPFDKLEKSTEKKSKKTVKSTDTVVDAKNVPADKEMAEKPEKSEPPVEKLADDEKNLVAKEIVEHRKDEVSEELANVEPDSVAESESIAGATFLEIVDEKLADGSDLDEALHMAEQETLEIAGLVAHEDEPDNLAEEIIEGQEFEADADPGDVDEDDPGAATGGGGTGFTPPPTSGGGGSGTPPPPGAGNIPPSPYGHQAVTHNQLTSQTIGNTSGNKQATRRAFVAGGVVGYLIGRRRGRIKTEAKLLPVQKSLEKEVKALQTTILEREQKIRTLTTNMVSRNPEAPKKMLERIQVLQELKYPEQQTKTVERTRALRQPEAVGKLFLKVDELKEETTLKPVNTMMVRELLTIAAKIKAEGSNLKHLYETGRIEERGLRRVVKEYLRGEKYDALLLSELKTPEKISENAAMDSTSIVTANTAGLHPNIADTTQVSGVVQQIVQPVVQPEQAFGSDKKSRTTVFVTVLVIIAVIILLTITR